jgi:hypothetical protein
MWFFWGEAHKWSLESGEQETRGYAANDTWRAGDGLSTAPTALASFSGSISQPFRAALTFGGRPSGPCINCNLCRVMFPQLVAGKSPAPAARRDRRGKGMTKERVIAAWRVIAGQKALFNPSPKSHLRSMREHPVPARMRTLRQSPSADHPAPAPAGRRKSVEVPFGGT